VILTELEKDVLVNGLYDSGFCDVDIKDIERDGYKLDNRIVVWSNCITDGTRIVSSKQIGGVISSLVKKRASGV